MNKPFFQKHSREVADNMIESSDSDSSNSVQDIKGEETEFYLDDSTTEIQDKGERVSPFNGVSQLSDEIDLAGTRLQNKKWILDRYPEGPFNPRRDFRMIHDTLALDQIDDDEVVVKVEAVAIDSSIRTMVTSGMNKVGEPISLMGCGKVIKENSTFAVGTAVVGLVQAATYAVVKSDALQSKASFASPSSSMGVLGIGGVTAYIGMFVCPSSAPQKGETVIVSAAAGVVGCIAAQIAKLCKARVIGITRGKRQKRFLIEDLKLDGAIDHADGRKAVDEQLDELCPNGIDFFFDNSGGDILNAVMKKINKRSRLVICGAISQNGDEGAVNAPFDYLKLAETSSTMSGFNTMHFPEYSFKAQRYLTWHYMRGNIICPLRTLDGIESFASTIEYLPTDEPCVRIVLDLTNAIDDNESLHSDNEEYHESVQKGHRSTSHSKKIAIHQHKDSQTMKATLLESSTCMMDKKSDQDVQVESNSIKSKNEFIQKELKDNERSSHIINQLCEHHEDERTVCIGKSKNDQPHILQSDSSQIQSEGQKVEGGSPQGTIVPRGFKDDQPLSEHTDKSTSESNHVPNSSTSKSVNEEVGESEFTQKKLKEEGHKVEGGSPRGTMIVSRKFKDDQPLSEHTDKLTSESNHVPNIEKESSSSIGIYDKEGIPHIPKNDDTGDELSFQMLVQGRKNTSIIQEDFEIEDKIAPPVSCVNDQQEVGAVIINNQELSIEGIPLSPSGSKIEDTNAEIEMAPPMTPKSVEEAVKILEDDDIRDETSSPMTSNDEDEIGSIQNDDTEDDSAAPGTMNFQATKSSFEQDINDENKMARSTTLDEERDSIKNKVMPPMTMHITEQVSDTQENDTGDRLTYGTKVGSKEEVVSTSCSHDDHSFDDEVTPSGVIPQVHTHVGDEESHNQIQNIPPFHEEQQPLVSVVDDQSFHQNNSSTYAVVGRRAEIFENDMPQNELSLDDDSKKTIVGGSTTMEKINLLPRIKSVNNDDIIIPDEKKAVEHEHNDDPMGHISPLLPVSNDEEVLLKKNHVIETQMTPPDTFENDKEEGDDQDDDQDEFTTLHSPRYKDGKIQQQQQSSLSSPSSYDGRRDSFCLSTDRIIMGELGEEEVREGELQEADDTWRTAGIWANNERDEETNEQTARDEIALKMLEVAEQMDINI